MDDAIREVLGCTFSPYILRKFDEVRIKRFMDDFNKWFDTVSWKYRSRHWVIVSKPDLENVEQNCTENHNNYCSILPTLMDRKILAPKHENSMKMVNKCELFSNSITPNMQPHVELASTLKLYNWSPIVKLSTRLKRLKRLNTLSVRVADVFDQKKPDVYIRVKSNFGCDETTVKVARSILETNPKLFKKKICVVLEDIVMSQLNSKPSKENFLAYLKLHHVDSPIIKNPNQYGMQKFLRSRITSNAPLSSELGILLRKPTDVQALVRLERTERFLNNPSLPTSSETYPVTYTKSPLVNCHTYKFSNRHTSLSIYDKWNYVKPVRVVITKAEMEAVTQKLLKLPHNSKI